MGRRSTMAMLVSNDNTRERVAWGDEPEVSDKFEALYSQLGLARGVLGALARQGVKQATLPCVVTHAIA
jgi:hypothetical protein